MHKLPLALLAQTETHLVALRRIRVRKCHIKAAFAFGGAFLIGVDAGLYCFGGCFPHLAQHYGAVAAGGGKVGAAMSGVVPFFDRMITSVGTEASA